MLEIKKKGKQFNVSLTRGDTAYIAINLVDESGAVIVLGDGDSVRCQVREAPNGGTLLFTGVIEISDEIIWHIRPEDTANADPKEYHWDCEVVFSNGDVFTFIPDSVFTILDEVTEG